MRASFRALTLILIATLVVIICEAIHVSARSASSAIVFSRLSRLFATSNEFLPNSPPVAVNDSYTVHNRMLPLTPGLLANDSDPDGDVFHLVGLVVFPSHGSISVDGDNVNYTAHAGYTGPDTFTYRICDDKFGCSAAATVSINIVNQPPVAAPDSYTVHGQTQIGSLIANDSDPENDPITAIVYLDPPAHGTRAMFESVPNSGVYDLMIFNPAAGYVGLDSFTYKICDNLNFCSNPTTVTIDIVNHAPAAFNYDTVVNGPTSIGPLLDSTSDPDGDLVNQIVFFTAPAYPLPAHGTLQFNQGRPGGAYDVAVYTPTAGFTGSDSFTYKVCDSLNLCSAVATITLYVLGDGLNNGKVPCNSQAGQPINVTNGNMYLQQHDYDLPAVGFGIDITRTYNSSSQSVGLFGKGWTSGYDESLIVFDSNLVRLNGRDGRAMYFGRPTGSTGSFRSLLGDFHAQLSAGSGYTLSLKNGSTKRFGTNGKLLSLTDRNGNTTTLNYAGNGSLSNVTDPFGRTLTFVTNANGLVTSISDSMGVIATYTYNTTQLSSVTYGDNSRYQFNYDAGSRLTSVADALGNIVESHTYDGQGRAITSEKQNGVERVVLNYVSASETDVTDALGHLTKYTIDKSRPRNVVTKIEGVCSCGGGANIQTWTYDDRLNVTATADALNHIKTYTYDTDGNRLTQTDFTGTITYTYNSFAEVLTRKDQMNNVSSATYDAQGNLLAITDALNNSTSFGYNSRGQLLTSTDARGKVMTFTYDSAGNLSQRRDANGITTFFFFDARGRLTKVRDPLSRSSLYAYDQFGRLAKLTHADLSFITFTYDQAGRVVTATDERGNPTRYVYDGASRLTAVTDALNHSLTYGYDSMSNSTSTTDALGRVTNFEYDDFNRVKKVIYPPAFNGATRLFETIAYDSNGNVREHRDTAGRIATFAYDGADRMTSTTGPDNKSTTVEFDALSRMTAVIDAINQRYEFGYDAVGRQTSLTRAGLSMSFVYDAVGNLTQRTDYNGANTNYVYDNLNRLTSVVYPSRTVSYNYDPLGNLTRATNENGSVYIGYDNRYRISSFSDPFYYGVSYNYDAAGNRTKVSLNGSTYATYTYDAVNRMTNLADGSNLNFSHTYDAGNRLVNRTAPNAVSTSYSYDGLDRLTSLVHANGSAPMVNNQYAYDDAGNIVSWSNASGVRTFGYDALNQLTSATYTSSQPNETYGYDAVGNRTTSFASSIYNYQPFNRLVGTSNSTYTYDKNGNMLSNTVASGTTTLSWNEENQLSRVTLPNGVAVDYKYDALGRRIQRATSNGGSERYVYDGQDVLLDLNADWSVANKYLNGPGIDNHLRQTSTTSGISYFLTDHLGSTAGLADVSGNLREQFNYDSFGNGGVSGLTRYTFTGRERDPDTGLMYHRARYYDPQLGRFISEDPIGLGGGINQFAYVYDNPLRGRDPLGLYEEDVHFYLTYYLALKTGCFADEEAREIANGDQGVDENPLTMPGLGTTERQRSVNAFYHALHPGSHQPYLDAHWAVATMGSRGSLSGLGTYLHYLQDTFSHEGFTDPVCGHGCLDWHYHDKTDSDADKAVRMAQATWYALTRFAMETKKCKCREWDDASWKTVWDFARASGGPDFRNISETELEKKRVMLRVDLR